MSEISMAAQKALSLTIPDIATLHSAYMPFFERGGLFVPTRGLYALGQQVVVLLTLPEESERISVTASVAWISPDGVAGHRIPGIGLHFGPQDTALRTRIEELLKDQPVENRPSFTL